MFNNMVDAKINGVPTLTIDNPNSQEDIDKSIDNFFKDPEVTKYYNEQIGSAATPEQISILKDAHRKRISETSKGVLGGDDSATRAFFTSGSVKVELPLAEGGSKAVDLSLIHI